MLTQGPFRAAQFVEVNDAGARHARLVLKTDDGLSLTSVVLWSHAHDDPGCGHIASDHSVEDAKLATSSIGRETLVVRILSADVYNGLAGRSDVGMTEDAYACAVDEKKSVTCQGPLVVGRSADAPPGFDCATFEFPRPIDPKKVSWNMRKERVLGPAGDLRLGP